MYIDIYIYDPNYYIYDFMYSYTYTTFMHLYCIDTIIKNIKQ